MTKYTYEPELEERKEFLRMRQRTGIQESVSIPDIDVRYKGKTDASDFILNKRLVRVWSKEAQKDEELLRSLRSLAKYPDIFPYIAVMPDYHIGENSVNGTIIPSLNTLYVNAIGGDIGCGMASLKLPVSLADVSERLTDIYETIYSRVPSGRRLNLKFDDRIRDMPIFYEDLEVLNNSNSREAMQQIGTLGSGNHFAEVQVDSEDRINIMIHSGSRGLGQIIRKIFSRKGKNIDPKKNLVVIDADSNDGEEYLDHVEFATRYAKLNRLEILKQVYQGFCDYVPKLKEIPFEDCLDGLIDLSHNTLTKEEHFGKLVYVHRKGATLISDGSLGLIPGSMGTHSYVVKGKGNIFSFESCSHGAGRKMSRGKALNTIRMEEFLESMQGILSRTDDSILDEAPQAYKNIDHVLRSQRDLVTIVEKLKPIAVIKG